MQRSGVLDRPASLRQDCTPDIEISSRGYRRKANIRTLCLAEYPFENSDDGVGSKKKRLGIQACNDESLAPEEKEQIFGYRERGETGRMDGFVDGEKRVMIAEGKALLPTTDSEDAVRLGRHLWLPHGECPISQRVNRRKSLLACLA